MMNNRLDSFDKITALIQNAAKRSGRKASEITLVAASKRIGLEEIKAAACAGVSVFGENRVQEGIAKFETSGFIKEIDALHLIGPLQTNKVKKAVGLFDLIHSVDSLQLAEKIDKEAGRRAIQQSVLIEVNIGGELSKHGATPDATPALVAAIRELRHLELLGLMTLPPKTDHPEDARPYFSRLRLLGNGLGLNRFSMGMSSDFEIAIEEGASWIRIGTALFGQREHDAKNKQNRH